MTHSGTQSEEAPEVGSLAEEAARLVGALSGWAREHGDLGPQVDDLASRATDALHDLRDHGTGPTDAADASDCSFCPVCRTVHAVRSLSPEVRSHLASAATSLVQAAAALMATAVPDPEDDPQEDPA